MSIFLTSNSDLSNLTWITLGVLIWLTMATVFFLLDIKDGYHGSHRVGTLSLVQQPNGLYEWERPRASWDFGDAPTVSLYRSGRTPEWNGEACYLA
jgi:hypothetical protein